MKDLDELRAEALRIFNAGLEAADPFAAVDRALTDRPLGAGPVLCLAIGKAACRMAEAALRHLPDDARVIVVTNYENAAPLPGAAVMAAGHPVPDANGARAAETVIAALEGLQEGARVLALISGGGSALLPAPVPGVTLDDKAAVNALLLASGADITAMNLVRQQLSRLKGGGLLRLAAPAPVRALILSDVIGDDLRVIASGLTTGPFGTRKEAENLLKSLGIWGVCPASVRACLLAPESPVETPAADNTLIGSNPISLAAMRDAAPGAVIGADRLEGDVADAARVVIDASRPGQVTLFGGETTVRIVGKGLGGRNQELALRVALLAEAVGWPEGWVYLQGGSDGRDGPTDAAGGLVDSGTLARMRKAGMDPEDVLARNDSYHGLKAADDLLVVGATGTNVADLGVLIRA